MPVGTPVFVEYLGWIFISGRMWCTACETAIAACRPGTEWHDVHRAAALVVAEGLVELGVLRGSPETLVESGAATLFFPHGVGHPVGLGVRDTGPASGWGASNNEASGTPRPVANFSSSTAVGLLSPRSMSEIIERLTPQCVASASRERPRAARRSRTRCAMRSFRLDDSFSMMSEEYPT